MSVRHLHDDTYQIDISLGRGKKGEKRPRYRENVHAGSKLEAVMIEQERRKQLGRTIKDVYSLNAIAEKYLEHVLNHQSPKTYKEKFRMLNAQILPFFGRFMPDYITSLLTENYKKKRLKEHPGINREINLEILCLKSTIRWGAEQTPPMCNNNLIKIKPLPYKRPIPEYVRKEELMSIIDNMGSLKHRIMFLCLYQAGLRKTEVCNLWPHHIHFQPDYILAHGKGGKRRLVAMSDLLARDFKAYLEGIKAGHCFPSRVNQIKGKQTNGIITDIRAPLKTAMKKAGITRRITPHMLRHAFATHMLESGADLRTIQEMMGHEDVSTTQIYTKVNPEHMSQAVKKAFPI